MKDQEEKLKDEILRDARTTATRRVERAKSESAKALDKIRRASAVERERRLAEADRLAEEKSRAILAGVELAEHRQWLQAREKEISSLLAEILREVENGEGVDSVRSLTQLLAEALAAIGPGELVLRIRPEDRERLCTGVVDAVVAATFPPGSAPARIAIQEDASIQGGLILVTGDGRKRFDNTYAAQLRRMKQELRILACAKGQSGPGAVSDSGGADHA